MDIKLHEEIVQEATTLIVPPSLLMTGKLVVKLGRKLEIVKARS